MSQRLFGTDGVRGTANRDPITAPAAMRLAQSAARVLMTPGEPPVVIVGRDTRASGEFLESAVASGLASLGIDVLLAGIIPTPAVAYLTACHEAAFGVVISASHNPFDDNGIKFFRHDGYKLDDQVEEEIERLVFTGEIESIRPTAGKIGRAARIDDALGRYVEFAKRAFPRGLSLEEMHVAVDVANGAA